MVFFNYRNQGHRRDGFEVAPNFSEILHGPGGGFSPNVIPGVHKGFQQGLDRDGKGFGWIA